MSTATLDRLCVPPPPPGPADWNDDGVVILPGLLTDDLIEAYDAEWEVANGYRGLSWGRPDRPSWPGDDEYAAPLLLADRPGGWPDCTPYMRHDGLRRIVCHPAITTTLERLLGEPAGVHLNLTGWVTTERDWHQDSYLNPPHVGDYYAAVWIALGPIHPDSGPFQYVPGSHRWPQVTRERIGQFVDLRDPAWPTHSEQVLSPLFDQMIRDEGAEVVTYLPSRGDVLIWHGRLLHRGSKANVPGAYRPALIAHYSGISHRADMPTARLTDEGGWLFPIAQSGPV